MDINEAIIVSQTLSSEVSNVVEMESNENAKSGFIRENVGKVSVGVSNSGLRLLDACFDDVGYARYLLKSKRAQDLDIRTKVNWKDHHYGVSILHALCYADNHAAVKLLVEHNADVNITNKVGFNHPCI